MLCKIFYSYLKKQNIELNDSYIEMLNIFTQIIQERGQYWLHIPNEKNYRHISKKI